MCGIFAYLGCQIGFDDIMKNFEKIQKRGPDNSLVHYLDDKVFFGFHRLSINDVSEKGNQPLYHTNDRNLVLICNGEIYNYKKLVEDNGFETYSNSDCEVILHLYKKYGIRDTLSMLDGVFSFVLYDGNENIVYAGRDPFGVRPLFIGKRNISNQEEITELNKMELLFSSEIKGISDISEQIETFKPGHYWDSKTQNYTEYYGYQYPHPTNLLVPNETNMNEICSNVNRLLTEAVDKRLMSDRPIGCLLSGGLDSSLIAALVARNYQPGTLETFSIGIKGSTDLYYAKMVAEHIQTKHHHIELNEQDFLDAIDEVIYTIESYDTTTVRASVGNYLVSKYIKQNTDCIVIYNGDGADEVCGSYLYLKNAPNDQEFHDECTNLLKEIHSFDVLRSDRCVSENGLEPRTPFLDKTFVNYYMSINPSLRSSKNRIEKFILRESFNGTGLLPDEVLWRQKEAFSDGVSGKEKSWYEIIQEMVDQKITDDEFKQFQETRPHNTPQLKESMYYRQVFEKYYGEKHSNIIPHFWLPKWNGNIVDPSARVLSVYK